MTELFGAGIVLIVAGLAYVIYLRTLPAVNEKRKRKNGEVMSLDEMLPEAEPVDPNALDFDTSDWVTRAWQTGQHVPQVGQYGDFMDWKRMRVSGVYYPMTTGEMVSGRHPRIYPGAYLIPSASAESNDDEQR